MPIATTNAYEELLTAFASHIGIHAETFVEMQEIVIDDLAIGLAYEQADDRACMTYFANLGRPAAKRAETVHQTLLEANHMWVGTGGATLGLQQATGNIIMAGQTSMEDLSPESLARLLNTFADIASRWKGFIDGHYEISETPPEPFALRA